MIAMLAFKSMSYRVSSRHCVDIVWANATLWQKVDKMLQSYNSEIRVHRGLAALVAASLLALSGTAMADSGFYAGGSVGNTTLEVNFEDPIEGGNFTFDESDFSWKVFGGFNFDLPVINLGVEGGSGSQVGRFEGSKVRRFPRPPLSPRSEGPQGVLHASEPVNL